MAFRIFPLARAICPFMWIKEMESPWHLGACCSPDTACFGLSADNWQTIFLSSARQQDALVSNDFSPELGVRFPEMFTKMVPVDSAHVL